MAHLEQMNLLQVVQFSFELRDRENHNDPRPMFALQSSQLLVDVMSRLIHCSNTLIVWSSATLSLEIFVAESRNKRHAARLVAARVVDD